MAELTEVETAILKQFVESLLPLSQEQRVRTFSTMQAFARPPLQADYSWLAHNRNRTQELLLDVYNLSQTHFPLESSTFAETGRLPLLKIWSALVGIGFSLWRAAFLVWIKDSNPRSWKEILPHAKAFLEQLIETNAINFSDDRNSRRWVVGYYLNNAIDRIDEVLQYLLEIPRNDYKRGDKHFAKSACSVLEMKYSRCKVESKDVLLFLQLKGITDRVERDVWETAYCATIAAVGMLKYTLEGSSPTHAGTR